jgi:NitT/TauT family transport system substrate-binding protein
MTQPTQTQRRRLLLCAGSLVAAWTFTPKVRAAGEVPIAIGVSPTLSGLAVHHANDKGYFREAGLDAKIVILSAGSAAVPQLLGGQLQFAAIDTVVALVARSKNIPLMFTAPNTVGIATPERGYGNLVATAASGAKTIKDLAGKTIAVNQINGTAWALARATLDNAGVDSSKVQFLEVPPPQLLAALQQGRADAAALAEPAVSMALAQGMRLITNVEATTLAGNHTFAFVSAEPWAKSHADAVRKFSAAMIRANTELNANRDLALAIAAKTTSVPLDVLSKVVMPNFGTTAISAETLQKVTEIAVKYGLVPADKMPPLASVIFK